MGQTVEECGEEGAAHAGVYDYFCLPHELAGMAGRIVVAVPGTRVLDGAAPAATGDGLRLPSGPSLAALPAIARILREGRIRSDPAQKERA